jgi:alpha-amylase/alpha-mannosidase (GH57 family)
MQRYVCVHGHFYQPPRENPWLEEVELEESASPFHDWNERITAQCYAPNTASRILDQERRIVDIVNNYSRISFNFGPTLLSWMERHKPEVHRQIVEADRLSQERFSGHGAALAQVYNHMILPLANERDKITQVLWGIRDFQHRFNRMPEGMWLPETAADTASLEVLADQGIAFTLLAQSQAARIRPLDEEEWIDLSPEDRIDPTRPYLCRLPSGNSIALFFYDGPISQDIAFGGLLRNGERLAGRLNQAFSEERAWPQLVHIATDGETYGHHHRMGDMALAYCLHHIERSEMARITIYGEYLKMHPPEMEVEIVEESSWSCFHGVERWRDDCGCHSGMHPDWTQAWRGPLREGLDQLRERVDPLFEAYAGELLSHPWNARDEYIELIWGRDPERVESFLARQTSRKLSRQEMIRLLKLLEIQRNAMLMYTSCGWFFDEISGIETTQVMKYAARMIQLAEEVFSLPLEEEFLGYLELAPSNIPEHGNGRRVYEKFVQPASVDFLFLGSHYALSSLFEEELENIRIYCYTAENRFYERHEAGQMKLALGTTRMVSNLTWDETEVSFAAVHLGEHNANCGIREHMSREEFEAMRRDIETVFSKGDIPDLIRNMDHHFGSHNYSLWHLFKDEQRKVLGDIIRSNLEDTESSLRSIVEQHVTLINFLTEINMPIPRALRTAAQTTVQTDLLQLFDEPEPDLQQMERLIQQAREWRIQMETTELGYKAGWKVDHLMAHLEEAPEETGLLRRIVGILDILQPLSLDLNLWQSQNIFFHLVQNTFEGMRQRASQGEEEAGEWIDLLRQLAGHLNVMCPEIEEEE